MRDDDKLEQTSVQVIFAEFSLTDLVETGEPRCAAAAAPCGVGAVINSFCCCCCCGKEKEDPDEGRAPTAADGGIGGSFSAPAGGRDVDWTSRQEGRSRLPLLLARPSWLLRRCGVASEREEDLRELLDLELEDRQSDPKFTTGMDPECTTCSWIPSTLRGTERGLTRYSSTLHSSAQAWEEGSQRGKGEIDPWVGCVKNCWQRVPSAMLQACELTHTYVNPCLCLKCFVSNITAFQKFPRDPMIYTTNTL